MIIEFSSDIILEEWNEINHKDWWHRRSRIDRSGSFIKVSIYYEYYQVKFWDELVCLQKYYQLPSNLSIEYLKKHIDQFLLTMSNLKAFM